MLKIESIKDLEALMHLVNKNKINKLTIGEITIESHNPAPKKYNKPVLMEQPRKDFNPRQHQDLAELDSILFAHETAVVGE